MPCCCSLTLDSDSDAPVSSARDAFSSARGTSHIGACSAICNKWLTPRVGSWKCCSSAPLRQQQRFRNTQSSEATRQKERSFRCMQMHAHWGLHWESRSRSKGPLGQTHNRRSRRGSCGRRTPVQRLPLDRTPAGASRAPPSGLAALRLGPAQAAAANLADQSAIPLASRAQLRIPAVTEKVPAPDSRAVLRAIRTSGERARKIGPETYGALFTVPTGWRFMAV